MSSFKTILEARNNETKTVWRIQKSIDNDMFWLENMPVNCEDFNPQDYGKLKNILISFACHISSDSFLTYP